MKKFALAIMAVTGLVLAACTEEPAQTDKPVKAKEYVVSLALGGEILDVSYGDLTKGENDHDLYGIQVDSRPVGEGDYAHYAYGLFDTLEGLTITLLDGYEYKFKATLVKDGKGIIQHYNSSYNSPFYTYGVGNDITEIGTDFIYALNEYLSVDTGYAYLEQGVGSYYHPDIDRYYGELSGFTAGDSETVTIEMKRVVFGLHVIASGMTEGTLTVQLSSAPTKTIVYPDTEMDEVFSLSSITNAWSTENYKESIAVSFTWTKDNDKDVILANRQFDFYRNKKTTITLTVVDQSLTPGLAVSLEDDTMGDGGSYDI